MNLLKCGKKKSLCWIFMLYTVVMDGSSLESITLLTTVLFTGIKGL